MNGFSEPYTLDRNRNGEWFMNYIREDIPSKRLDKYVFSCDMEGLFILLNVRKSKWLLFWSYHPPSQVDIYYFDNLNKTFDTYSSYEKCLLIGDFKKEISEPRIDSFVYEHELHNLVKEKPYSKSVHNPSCIDFILTNNGLIFQNAIAAFTGLSDFHKLVLTVLKSSITKCKLQKITHRDYKNFDSVRFNEWKYVFTKEKTASWTKFDEMLLRILSKHAPLKRKLLRENRASYIFKPLRKAIR